MEASVGNTDEDLSHWNPFHTTNWPRSIAHPDQYAEHYENADRLAVSWDLGAISEGDKKKVIKQWCARLPELQKLRWLNLWSQVTPSVFEAACQIHGLECLVIKWSNIKRLDAISNLHRLKYLYIGSSTRVESIEPLTALVSLRRLDIENFKLVSDFSPLTTMTWLESLAIAGSMWSRQKVDSLEPLSQMTWLKSLAVDTSHVKSLRPLAQLTSLESLDVDGRLPMEEYAWLSAKLPGTDCRWFQPFLDLADSGIGYCKQCKTQSMVMLTGKGKGTVCRHCDADKVARHEAAFNAVRAGVQ